LEKDIWGTIDCNGRGENSPMSGVRFLDLSAGFMMNLHHDVVQLSPSLFFPGRLTGCAIG
jgi:hypothetical protein